MQGIFHGYGAVDISSCATLAVAQGLTVVLPRPRGLALQLPRRCAAALPPMAFVATVAALALKPAMAGIVFALAVVAVPVLGALAMAAFTRGGRPARALLVLPLLLLAAAQGTTAGQLAGLTLVMLSCVALGSLLAAAARVRDLVIAALALSVVDLALMSAGSIQHVTAVLLQARAAHLPDFAQPVLGTVTIGYGDFFIAALAGAVAASRPSQQWLVGLATTFFALVQYALSSHGDMLPATVPVAIALVVGTAFARVRRRRRGCPTGAAVDARERMPARARSIPRSALLG